MKQVAGKTIQGSSYKIIDCQEHPKNCRITGFHPALRPQVAQPCCQQCQHEIINYEEFVATRLSYPRSPEVNRHEDKNGWPNISPLWKNRLKCEVKNTQRGY